ncbi:MAG: glycerate kinase [Promicromonosporaceae bacterium]|nr:glycerate kinase [Promicromonosporaceae bacterium]
MSAHVVVAPDSFKGSLAAPDVAAALEAGVRAAAPSARVTSLPLADGGEGSLAALAAAWGVPQRPVSTVDALGRPTTAHWAMSPDGRTGVVELAQASGLPAVADVQPPQPLAAHTRGTGALAAAVLEAGVEEVIVCLGGSASTDGGAGLLTGLGVRVLDGRGVPVQDGGAGVAEAASLDLSGLHPRAREVRWRVAVDVSNPLTGEHGAAAVFGPQKGAEPGDVAFLDEALARWAGVLERATGRAVRGLPGGGAAGGVPVALVAVLGATVERGIDLVSRAVGLPAALEDADLVITGEGRFDAQSVHGKVPDGVARAAAASDRHPPVVVVAGQVDLPQSQTRASGFRAAISLASGPATLDELLADAPRRLTEVAAAVTALVLGPEV